MYKASPKVTIPGLAKAAVDASSAAETIPAVASFINVDASYQKMSKGLATITSSIFPHFCKYDRAVLSVKSGGTFTAGDIINLYQANTDGTKDLLGSSVATANGFPDIEFDVVEPAAYFVQVFDSTGAVTLAFALQGNYRAMAATT